MYFDFCTMNVASPSPFTSSSQSTNIWIRAWKLSHKCGEITQPSKLSFSSQLQRLNFIDLT